MGRKKMQGHWGHVKTRRNTKKFHELVINLEEGGYEKDTHNTETHGEEEINRLEDTYRTTGPEIESEKWST